MSKSKTYSVPETQGSSLSEDIATTLSNLSAGVTANALDERARRNMRDRSARCPDALVELVCHLAEQNGGNVLGMAFDATTARATLASVSKAQTAIRVARQLLQRMEDDVTQQRIKVADPTFALYTALRRLVNTESGNALKPAYEQMKQIVKNRPRRTRGTKSGSSAQGASAKPATANAKAPAPQVVVADAHASPQAPSSHDGVSTQA